MSKNKTLLFWAIAFGLFVLFGLYQYLPYGPYGMHQGAQADRVCIGLNYYQESMNFFEPRVMESRNMKGVTGQFQVARMLENQGVDYFVNLIHASKFEIQHYVLVMF